MAFGWLPTMIKSISAIALLASFGLAEAFCPPVPFAPSMTHWRASVNAVLSGTSNARLVVVGDSLTAGADAQSGQANDIAYSYPTVLAQTLTTGGIRTSWQSTFGDNNWAGTVTNYDSRISIGGYPTTLSSPNTFTGRLRTGNASVSTSPFTFTPTSSVDSFDFYWLSAPGQGSMNIDIDGSGTVTLNANTTAGVHKTTITTGTSGTHTFRVSPVSGQTSIQGVVGYDSSAKEIQIINGGWNGARVASWIQSTGGGHYYDPLDVLSFLAPDLTIICLTVNDAHSITNMTDYKNALNTIITTAKFSGDVLLLVGPPVDTSYATQPWQDAFNVAYREVAEAQNVPILYPFGGGYTDILTGSYGSGDGIHLVAAGYAAFANYLVSLVSLH